MLQHIEMTEPQKTKKKQITKEPNQTKHKRAKTNWPNITKKQNSFCCPMERWFFLCAGHTYLHEPKKPTTTKTKKTDMLWTDSIELHWPTRHIEYNPMLDLRYYIHRIIHLNVKTAEYLLIYHWWFLRHFFLWFCFCFVVVAFYFLFLGTQLSKISILVFLLLLSCCCVLCVIGIHSGIQWHSATTTNTINKTSKNY